MNVAQSSVLSKQAMSKQSTVVATTAGQESMIMLEQHTSNAAAAADEPAAAAMSSVATPSATTGVDHLDDQTNIQEETTIDKPKENDAKANTAEGGTCQNPAKQPTAEHSSASAVNKEQLELGKVSTVDLDPKSQGSAGTGGKNGNDDKAEQLVGKDKDVPDDAAVTAFGAPTGAALPATASEPSAEKSNSLPPTAPPAAAAPEGDGANAQDSGEEANNKAMDSNTPSSSSKHKGGDLGMNASDASTQAQFAYTEEKGTLLTIILVSQLFGGTHLFVSFSS
jgi:hypothetical protein